MPKLTLTQAGDWRSSTGSFCFVDVGSRDGFGEMRLLHPLVRMYSIDADPSISVSPADFASFEHFPLALYSSSGEMDLYVTAQPGMTSLLRVDEPVFLRHFGLIPGSEVWLRGMTAVRTERVRTVRAGDFFREQALERIDFLKLDTQGTEIEILKGAVEYLAAYRVSVIKTEVCFHPLYRGQCTFSDVDAFLRGLGYVFVDCMFYPDAVFSPSQDKAAGAIALEERLRFSAVGDAVYVLDPAVANDDRGALIRAAVILNQLGYVSMAYRLLTECGHASAAAEELLRATAATDARHTRTRALLREHLPPWLFRRARKVYRALFAGR